MLNVDIGKQIGFELTDENIAALSAHENVKTHVWYIGLRNILMDSHASAKRELFDDEIAWRNASKAMAEKKLAAMLAGEIRANSSGPRISSKSPIEQEARKIARAIILPKQKNVVQLEKWAKSFGFFNGDYNDTEEQRKSVLAEAIKRYAAKPETIATATANVAAQAALVVDDDLGL